MSLFKRKHSKADIQPPPASVQQAPPASVPSTQQKAGYGSVGVAGGGNANPRRMTSNPQLNANVPQGVQPPIHPSQIQDSAPMSMPQPGFNPPHRQSQSPIVNGPGGPAAGFPTPPMNGSPHMSMSPQSHPGQGMYPAQQSQIAPPAGQDPAQQQHLPKQHDPSNFPWQVRHLRTYPPSSPNMPNSPFPRYGLSVPCFPSHSGHMLLFGGLINERVRNDLWSIDIRDYSTMYVKTKGDTPPPRVGHASVIMDRILIVWGGDTKVNASDPQDEGLYVLDLRSQEWTLLPVARGPVGRYGHAVCMVESKFYVFGGQADGAFMNDMWSYDIKQLTSPNAPHVWEQVTYTTPPPPARTGHVLVSSSSGKIYLFGGTDGNYHYNDTWSFDPATGAWSELTCIGFIPLPREGHAAAIVDDTIYVFGGRDVKGKDLGDLSAFKLSNQRWYMFQNMGPAPTARSGHAMVSAHGKIFIVGGEANQVIADQKDDPALVHYLDTTKIKYPADKKPRDDGMGAQPGQSPQRLPHSGSKEQLHTRAGSPLNEGTTPPAQSLGAVITPPTQTPEAAQIPPQVQVTQPPVQSPATAQQPRSIPKTNGAPPQRPHREGDEEYREAMSPANPHHPELHSPQSSSIRVSSPINNSPASPKNHPKMMFNSSLTGTRSPSPRLRNADGTSAERERAPPPPDAFYYGRRSPTTNGFSPHSVSGRPSSLGPSTDLIRELKARDIEVEDGKKREAALKAILSRAMKQGFVFGDERPEGMSPDMSIDENEDGGERAVKERRVQDVVGKLTDALVRLKKEKAELQNELTSQVHAASGKSREADTLRRGALQETAFYRAKIAALESNSAIDLKRLEQDRTTELEKQIGVLVNENADLQKELERERDNGVQTRDLHSSATEREAETLKRAEEAEEAHRKAVEELEQLHARFSNHEQSIREHSEQLVTLSSTLQQREAERETLLSQLNDAVTSRDQYIVLVEEAQRAVDSGGAMASEMEAMYAQESQKVARLVEQLAETQAELEKRSQLAEIATERLQEIEKAYAISREEADSLRGSVSTQLGAILDSHKELRADESRLTRGHQDKLRALEVEGTSLRKMLNEAGQRVDAAESGVSQHRSKARELEGKVQALRGELRAGQTKLMSAQSEVTRYKELNASRDEELREKELAVTEVETRCTMLRNLLAEHGIAINSTDLDNVETPSSRELETQLRDRNRANESAQREIQSLRARSEEAEDKVESLSRLIERIKDARSPTSYSMRSPTPTGGEAGRVGELEKKLNDMTKEHKDKVAGLEADYQTAVRYVKGTEKMLKRMKDELNKQKATNATIQTELDHLRGRSSVSGRSTPSSMLESDVQRRFSTLQTQHQKLQEDYSASQDVLSARNREVDLLRMRLDEAERDLESLREDLAQAQHRIQTLLDVRGVSDDDEAEGSEEATLALDKFTKELRQWERSRSPGGTSIGGSSDEDETIHMPGHSQKTSQTPAATKGHQRNSSEYSGEWAR
ncbi:hypothetical protein L202_02097 [Cryptococcus amylolentus CBS 6039]|uniref:Uncharacterized protein n=2 Tax=Cryptococcus amylolentus TaxID=104669 RepID=A0A1E3HZC0_9TREE|nr:hypothetical protein L202_02097 [Cryptococcus amylolentus CBS 6039]ODN81703.1 hypothetical protein L202_02097 [Cryptococcus amylolentus CBS 6039]